MKHRIVSRKLIIIGIVLVMLLTMLPFTAMAAEPSFSLSITPQKVSEGQQVNVKVIGTDLTEVYGYEIKLSFDDKLLRYVKTVSGISGFSVPPKDTAGGKLVFAHTKIGKAAGISGTVELAEITFTALGKNADKARVILDNVRLVKSDLTSSDVAAKVSTSIDIAASQERKPIFFTDLKGHWAKQAIERAASLGIVNGYSDGTFRPANPVTRAEFTVMIARAFTLKSTDSITPEFADASQVPSWAKTSIAEAAAAGIITGYADKTFRPNEFITRTEMAAILARVLELELDANAQLSFVDTDKIAPWARPAIAAAVKAGIVKGRGGNTFSPMSTANRAEAITIILAGLDAQASKQQ